jgi:acetyl-CoA carboxylase carboxyltransferase component
LDEDSPFMELSGLAAWGSDFAVGASVVTGIGVISGVECMISASDPTVRGGASNPWTIKKVLRANEIALTNRLPMINLTESGGADLPTQKEIFIPGGADVPRPHPALGGGHPGRGPGVRQLHRRRVRTSRACATTS